MNNTFKVEVNISATQIRRVDVQVRNLLASVKMSELSKVEVNSTGLVYKYTLYFNESQLVDVEKNLQGIVKTIGKLTVIVDNNVVVTDKINLKDMV